jgi:methionyl-tRNA formyltransferase
MNIVLAGEESAGLQTLRAVANGKHRLIAVLAAPPKPGAAGVSVWNVARDLGFETWPADLVEDAELGERLRCKRVDLLLNVHSRYIVNRQVLAAPVLGAYNLHPAALPRYAGLNAVSWAIFNGERTHGVTVHKMEPEIDTGPIAYQCTFPIEDEDTALSLSFKCIRHGVPLILHLLETAATDASKIPALPQDLSSREYFGAGRPEHGQISWSWLARKVINFVRACDYFPFSSPWGHPRTCLRGQEIAVIKARLTGVPCDVAPGTVGTRTDAGIHIACGDQWILANKLKANGKSQGAAEILTSGDRLGD